MISGYQRVMTTRTPADTALEVDDGVLFESFRVLLLKADDAAASLPTAALTSDLEACNVPRHQRREDMRLRKVWMQGRKRRTEAYGLDLGTPCFSPADTSRDVASEAPTLERRSGRDEKYLASMCRVSGSDSLEL
jgi:hypothetical protein